MSGNIDFTLHKFQDEAWQALKDPEIREIGLFAGIQGGKTIFGAFAMQAMIKKWQRLQPGSNFIISADSYKTLHQATIPTFLKVISANAGKYIQGKEEFVLKKGGKVFARTATDPNSVEGIPDCAFAWCDEAGKCSKSFQINLLGRVARLRGKVLYTSTPYAMNWLYHDVQKPFDRGERKDIKVIQFSSADNPVFPKEEYERQRQILDPKIFRRKYMGIHERMEGLVYDLTSDNFCDAITLPKGTRYFAGVDFGFTEGHEYSIVISAFTPDGNTYDIKEFKKAGLDPNAQVMLARSLRSIYPIEMFYCDPARPDMISAFNAAGLPSVAFHEGREGYKPIVAGITKHIELIRSGKYRIFRKACPQLEDEYETYHWPETDEGIVEKEVPVKLNDNLMDARRYLTIGMMHLRKAKDEPFLGSRVHRVVDTFDPSKRSTRVNNWDEL